MTPAQQSRFDELPLYPAQVQTIAGISRDTLDYWTMKANVPTTGNVKRMYPAQSWRSVCEIASLREQGWTLEGAIRRLGRG